MSANYNFEQRKITLQTLLDTALIDFSEIERISDLDSIAHRLMEIWGAWNEEMPKEEKEILDKILRMFDELIDKDSIATNVERSVIHF